jgi:hypothetical protein
MIPQSILKVRDGALSHPYGKEWSQLKANYAEEGDREVEEVRAFFQIERLLGLLGKDPSQIESVGTIDAFELEEAEWKILWQDFSNPIDGDLILDLELESGEKVLGLTQTNGDWILLIH